VIRNQKPQSMTRTKRVNVKQITAHAVIKNYFVLSPHSTTSH